MKLKGFLKIFAAAFIAVVVFSQPVFAEESYDFGQDEIYDALPEEASSELEELDITPENGGSSLTVESVLSTIWETVKSNAAKPLAMLASVAAVIILCAVIEAMHDGGNDIAGTFHTVGILACSGIICTSFAGIIESSKIAIDGLSSFISVYIPAFAGIMAVNGQTATAAAYNGIIIVATQLLSQLFSLIIFPLSSCIMGISVAGAVNPDLKINNIAEMAKKLINWGLGLLMTVFSGLLSVQSFVNAAADSVSMKAVKFTVSGALPIVGSAVSDALSTVKSSMNLLKSTVGSFGIIASVSVILPVLISVVLFRISLLICASVSEVFGTSRLTILLKSGESILSIIIAMIVCFWLVTAVSTAFMLVIGGGAA